MNKVTAIWCNCLYLFAGSKFIHEDNSKKLLKLFLILYVSICFLEKGFDSLLKKNLTFANFNIYNEEIVISKSF